MIRTLAAILALSCTALPAHAAPGDAAEAKRLLMDSVGIASVKGRGQTPALARFYRDALVQAGFNAADIQIDELAGTVEGLVLHDEAARVLGNALRA